MALDKLPSAHFSLDISSPRTATVLTNVSKNVAAALHQLLSIHLLGTTTPKLLWNFGDISSLQPPLISFSASILAPDASVVGSTDVNGDIFAENLNMNNAKPITIHDNKDGFEGVLPQYSVIRERVSIPPQASRPRDRFISWLQRTRTVELRIDNDLGTRCRFVVPKMSV
jgi:hypothetical protein